MVRLTQSTVTIMPILQTRKQARGNDGTRYSSCNHRRI